MLMPLFGINGRPIEDERRKNKKSDGSQRLEET